SENIFVSTTQAIFDLSFNTGDIIWEKLFTNNHLTGAPTIDSNNVYIYTLDMSGQGVLHSYRINDGNLNYEKGVNTKSSQWEVFSPVIYDGMIFMPIFYSINAYDANDVKLLWESEINLNHAAARWTPTIT